MSERDELARVIMAPENFDGGPVSCGPNDVYAARTADAILAAGYRKPRTITTHADLEDLHMVVVRTDAGTIANIVNGKVYCFGYEQTAPVSVLSLPATVLWEPK